MAGGEIIVVPFHTQGHILPATELCRQLAARNYSITLLLPSGSGNSTAPLHPLIRIVDYPAPHPPEIPPPNGYSFPGPRFPDHSSPFRDLLARRSDGLNTAPPLVCAVVDVMTSQLLKICREFDIPAVSFFTSSACSTALDLAASKLSASHEEELGPGRTLALPGLPEDMALTVSDLAHRGGPPPAPAGLTHPGSFPPPFPFGHPGGPLPAPAGPSHPGSLPPPFPFGHPGGSPPPFGPGIFGGPPPPPPGPGNPGGPPPPQWGAPPPEPGRGGGGGGPPPPGGLAEADGAVALLFNTSDDLERPFLDYVAKEAGRPVWGVGPLLPAQFWSAAGSVVRDEEARRPSCASNVKERDVLEWLDSKPRGSVIYVSFGSLVAPSDAELAELAAGLEESRRPFIWALQPGAMRHDTAGRPAPASGQGYFPVELARLAEEEGRGMVIRGWAPQLLILSHQSTGGFLTHCGWNSTVEAIGCGVPMLAWPIHGDQMHNAKLVISRLKVGHSIRSAAADGGDGGGVTRDDVVQGIERLMSDEEMREQAASMRSIRGFPESSSASLDAFLGFLSKNSH